MNHGAWNVIQKWNAKACNRKHNHYQGQEATHVVSLSKGENYDLFFDHKIIVQLSFLNKVKKGVPAVF
jgi:hypothetical protein